MKIREFTFIPEDKEKPIKMVFENDFKAVQTTDCTIEMVRRLSPIESEHLLRNMFGTTDVGILDCSDMSDEEIDRIVDEFNSIGCTSFQMTADELREFIEKEAN